MLLRAIRPLTARTTGLATASTQVNTSFGPFAIRTIASAVEVAAPEPIPTPTPTPISVQQAPRNEQGPLPYFVARNWVGNFSVYNKTLAAATRKFTFVKRVEGDVWAFKNDLQDALKLDDAEIHYNQRTGHFRIKGQYRQQVLAYLTALGF